MEIHLNEEESTFAIETVKQAIDLLDNTHNYDSEEFKKLKALRDVLEYGEDLQCALDEHVGESDE